MATPIAPTFMIAMSPSVPVQFITHPPGFSTAEAIDTQAKNIQLQTEQIKSLIAEVTYHIETIRQLHITILDHRIKIQELQTVISAQAQLIRETDQNLKASEKEARSLQCEVNRQATLIRKVTAENIKLLAEKGRLQLTCMRFRRQCATLKADKSPSIQRA